MQSSRGRVNPHLHVRVGNDHTAPCSIPRAAPHPAPLQHLQVAMYPIARECAARRVQLRRASRSPRWAASCVHHVVPLIASKVSAWLTAPSTVKALRQPDRNGRWGSTASSGWRRQRLMGCRLGNGSTFVDGEALQRCMQQACSAARKQSTPGLYEFHVYLNRDHPCLLQDAHCRVCWARGKKG